MSLVVMTITDHETCGDVLTNGQGYDDAEDVNILGPFDHVISIVGTWEDEGDPPGGWEVWNNYPARKLRLQFDDLQVTNSHGDAPTEAHVQKIIDFAKGINGGAIIIHCAAGVSRSTAAGLIVLATMLRSPKRAVEYLCQVRSANLIRPHRNMIAMADDLLAWNGLLLAARDQVWRA